MAKLASASTPRTASHSTAEYRAKEEANLTTDLKQKVALIEEQWLEALGNQLLELRERVKLYLQENDGWDDLQQAEE